jgi:hypothetical protein
MARFMFCFFHRESRCSRHPQSPHLRARACIHTPHTPPATTTTMTTTTILPPSGQSDLYPDAPMVKGIWNTHAPLLDVVHIDGVDHVMVC